MTSEQRFQGYSLDRNSSKVMAPPGGKTSISFGSYEPPAPKPASKPNPAPAAAPAAPAAAAPAAATPAAAAPAAATAAPVADTPAGARVTKVDRFEKEHQVSNCQKARNESSVFGAPDPAKNKRQAVKIVAPPGGQSSITFG